VKRGSEGGTVHFSDWNKPFSVSAPSPSDVLDISKLQD
jgi:hypothetical protein